MCADPITVRCSLLFTLLGAWSGDKWLSKLTISQYRLRKKSVLTFSESGHFPGPARHVLICKCSLRISRLYLCLIRQQMLKHAGMLDQQPAMIPSFHGSLELQWRDWLARETQNRYVLKNRIDITGMQL